MRRQPLGLLGRNLRGNPDQALAQILATVQLRDRTRGLLDSVQDVLPVADLPVAHPVLEFVQCPGIALDMVEDEKALHSRALDEKMTFDPRSFRWRVPARDGRRAADHHPCTDRETSHDGVGDRAGCVVEVDIDAVRTGDIKRRLKTASLVVHRSVVAELLAAYPHFVRPAGDADGTAPLDLGDLAGA